MGNLIRPPFCLFSAQTTRRSFFDWTLPERKINNDVWRCFRMVKILICVCGYNELFNWRFGWKLKIFYMFVCTGNAPTNYVWFYCRKREKTIYKCFVLGYVPWWNFFSKAVNLWFWEKMGNSLCSFIV